MEKKYFPVFMDLSEKKIVVIGGGTIASRRVNTLLSFTESVTVAAPMLSPALQALFQQGRIIWLESEYEKKQIQNADIVIAATNRQEINRQIRRDCRLIEAQTGRRILVNVIDEKALCDFYFPSIVQTQEVVIGINSGGTSPGTSKRIRQKIEAFLKSISLYD